MSQATELWAKSAVEVVALLRRGELLPTELLASLEPRIAGVDPQVNALPTRCFERAYERAALLEQRPIRARGVLAGLPIPIKDSAAVAGVRTTYGSPVFADHVPERSDYHVERIEGEGGVIYAKSNTPEFEAGANTFNEVFGRTLNPWDTRKSAAGSSGGAAVAVATGMAWIAQGSDFACSLRYPASFCGVVGLRPTPGLIAQGPSAMPYQNLSVIGPIGRSVLDVALAVDAMTGLDPRDPLSFPTPVHSYVEAARISGGPKRVAYSRDLGITPIDPSVSAVCDRAIGRLQASDLSVDIAHPRLDGVHDIFRILRSFQFTAMYGHLLERHRDKVKPEVVWNIEEGAKLGADDIARAERERARLRLAMLDFLSAYEFLMTPTAIVPPYPVEARYVDSCAGHRFANYLEWMSLAYVVTLASCPAISLPCGFTADGLPIGLQIIARPRRESDLLAFAHRVESALDVALPRPIDPATPSPPS